MGPGGLGSCSSVLSVILLVVWSLLGFAWAWCWGQLTRELCCKMLMITSHGFFFLLCVHAYMLWVEASEILFAQALLTCTSSLSHRQTLAIRGTKPTTSDPVSALPFLVAGNLVLRMRNGALL